MVEIADNTLKSDQLMAVATVIQNLSEHIFHNGTLPIRFCLAAFSFFDFLGYDPLSYSGAESKSSQDSSNGCSGKTSHLPRFAEHLYSIHCMYVAYNNMKIHINAFCGLSTYEQLLYRQHIGQPFCVWYDFLLRSRDLPVKFVEEIRYLSICFCV